MQLTQEAYRDLEAKNYQSSLQKAKEAYQLSEKIGFLAGIGKSSTLLAYGFQALNDTEQALKHYIEAINTYETLGDYDTLIALYAQVGAFYHQQQAPQKALEYYQKSETLYDSPQNIPPMLDERMGLAYTQLSQIESAFCTITVPKQGIPKQSKASRRHRSNKPSPPFICNSKNWEQANVLYQDLLTQNPEPKAQIKYLNNLGGFALSTKSTQ
ncbi:MAG: tetratricopeptide repeat protein [Saprospiraceae bacterium]|nr:tetratricopeptide repeat protein [Saprospiraceae bacterium]